MSSSYVEILGWELSFCKWDQRRMESGVFALLIMGIYQIQGKINPDDVNCSPVLSTLAQIDVIGNILYGIKSDSRYFSPFKLFQKANSSCYQMMNFSLPVLSKVKNVLTERNSLL